MDYPMSYIELIGTIFNLWSVWLVARNRIATWPVGIVGIVLFMTLFYQIRLYSDVYEQIYFLIMSFYGWWQWAKLAHKQGKQGPAISFSTAQTLLASIIVTIAATILSGNFIGKIHIYFPSLFPEMASYPYLDALTTVMSFVATFLMARKKVECWYYWIAVDVIGVVLYYVKNIRFVSLLYLIFLVMATNGLVMWVRKVKAVVA